MGSTEHRSVVIPRKPKLESGSRRKHSAVKYITHHPNRLKYVAFRLCHILLVCPSHNLYPREAFQIRNVYLPSCDYMFGISCFVFIYIFIHF